MGDNVPGKSPMPVDLSAPVAADSPTVTGSAALQPQYHPLRDLWRGAVYGARAVDRLGPLGIFAWILTGFVPVLGTVVALRDAQYAWKVGDGWSLFFNLLGILPFVKGFATIAVLARVKRYHRVMHSAHHVASAARSVRRGWALGAAGNPTARSVVTGAAHGAGTLTSMRHDDAAPALRNRTAWPALVFGLLLLLLLLPTYIGVAIVANVDSAGLLRRFPLPSLLALSGVALLVSLASLLFARHARQVSRRLKERGRGGRARLVVSWLAVMCTRVAFLMMLGAVALLLYGERATILPR